MASEFYIQFLGDRTLNYTIFMQKEKGKAHKTKDRCQQCNSLGVRLKRLFY
jgi:hypothetical protein